MNDVFYAGFRHILFREKESPLYSLSIITSVNYWLYPDITNAMVVFPQIPYNEVFDKTKQFPLFLGTLF